jgi:hypothetical protein
VEIQLAVVVVAVDVAYLPRAPSAFGIRQFPYRVFQATTSLNLSYHVGVLAMSGAISARKCRASTQVSRQLNSLEYSRRSPEEVAGPRVAGGPPSDLNPARRGAGTVPLGRAKGSGQSLSIVRPVSLWTLRGLKERARARAAESAAGDMPAEPVCCSMASGQGVAEALRASQTSYESNEFGWRTRRPAPQDPRAVGALMRGVSSKGVARHTAGHNVGGSEAR